VWNKPVLEIEFADRINKNLLDWKSSTGANASRSNTHLPDSLEQSRFGRERNTASRRATLWCGHGDVTLRGYPVDAARHSSPLGQ
jgi:hypothetical protein